MMQRHLGNLGTAKNSSHDASVEGKAHECRASKVDHIKYQSNSAPCCPILVPRNDSALSLQGKAAVALEA
jgi:hypothetical protein